MIYSDGAGAALLEARQSEEPEGIPSHSIRSDSYSHAQMLYMGPSNKANGMDPDQDLYLKMNGRKLYQYALEKVPEAIKYSLDKSGVRLEEVKKALLHQANGKMAFEILKRLYALYDNLPSSKEIMP